MQIDLSEDDKGKPFNGQVLYREWGRRFTILQQYHKGIRYYEESTNHGDENFIWTLLGLSEALKKSGQLEKAADVAKKCMNIDPSHMRAYYTRTEALFDTAEFCQSLVYAHRGLRRRQHFRNAVILAEGVVNDCVGDNVSPIALMEMRALIARLESHRERLLEKADEEIDEFAGIGDDDRIKFRENDPALRHAEQQRLLDRMMANIYLGRSCHDKYFLDDLTTHRALKSSNKTGSAQLLRETRACLDSLQNQQNALRTRKPIYVIRAQKRIGSTKSRERENWQELLVRRCMANRLVGFVMRKLHAARLARDYRLFFRLVERAKEKFEELGDRRLPDRDIYLDVIYRMVARVYLDPRNMLRQCDKTKDQQLSYLRRALGLKTRGINVNKKLSSWDIDVAWPACPDVYGTVNKCKRRLGVAGRPLEILWIYHELCKHFLQIRRYDRARFYSKRIRDLGTKTGYEEWVLNGIHILLRIELEQHNKLEALETAQSALESAQRLEVDFLVDFYERALRYVASLDFDHFGGSGGEDGTDDRVKLMIGLTSDELRPRLNLLLKAMRALPRRRRLTIMPGCVVGIDVDRKSRRGEKISVIPSPPGDIEIEARRKLLERFAPGERILGFVDFERYD